jgi:hypothetical protein
LGDALGRSNLAILTLYTPEGRLELEDPDRGLLMLQVEEPDYDGPLRAVDDAFSPTHHRDIGVNPRTVFDTAPEVTLTRFSESRR